MAGEQINTHEPDYTANLAALGETFDEPQVQGDQNAEQQTPNVDPQAGTEQKTETPQEAGSQSEPVLGDKQRSKPDSGKQQGKKEEGQNPPGPKDLTLSDGTVVKAGTERRWYDNWQLALQKHGEAARQLNTTTQQLSQLQERVKGYETSLQAISALPPEQVTAATRLYSDLSRDVVGTLTKLLAEAKAAGHNIDGIGGAVDTAAIQRMLQNQNTPRSENQGLTQEQINQQADAEVGEFFARFPDAVQHEQIIANIVSRHPDVPLADIYFKLKQDVINKGLDWTQPLAPQIQARTQQQQPQQQQQAPMLNGRAAPALVEEKMTYTPAAGETFDDIIKASMADAGYPVSR